MSSRAEMTKNIISSTELIGHLDHEDWIIIDCRFDLTDPAAGEAAYRAGHIPGARYAHLDNDLAGPVPADGRGGRHPLPDPQTLCATFGAWGIANDKIVIAYDDAAGAIAARLWWLLRWLGHTRVAVLDGGLTAWQRIGGQLESRLPRVAATRFLGTPGSMPTISAAEVSAGLDSKQLLLLDARAADRFAGHVEPIDKIAGHVPGATNAPFSDNLTADKCFRESTELRAYYDSLSDGEAQRVACMCGSGVTACHTILAAEHAGWPTPELYVGSWSDWSSQPDRPIGRDEKTQAPDQQRHTEGKKKEIGNER